MVEYSIQLPPLYTLQQQIADDRTRFKILACGRRFGKTLMCVEICFKKAFEGKRVWWVAHTYGVAGIAWRMTISLINQLPKEFDVSYNIATRTINFNKTGGEFVFKSSDRPDSLRGEGLDFLVMDEAAFHKKNIWNEILRPALADRKGSAIFISTPNPKKNGMWFEQMFKDGQNPKMKNMNSWQLTSYLNPYLDPEEIDQIREVTPDAIFRREFLAQFVSDDMARISRESIQYIDIDELKGNQNLAIAIGADLAISEKSTADYTAVACVARDIKTGAVYVLDIYRDRLSFAKQKELIRGFADKWNRPDLGWPEIVIGIENVGYQDALVQEVSREVGYAVYGIPSTKDKIARFASLEAKYEKLQVWHVEGLSLSFENELLSFPEGEHDDYEDAMEKAYKAINIAYGFTSGGFTFDLSEKDNVFSF
jgi:predicted phage terminase large subunit-like protein